MTSHIDFHFLFLGLLVFAAVGFFELFGLALLGAIFICVEHSILFYSGDLCNFTELDLPVFYY
jgi:hypothetical protein